MDVLFMKAMRCAWGGKCKFCTYWLDNTQNLDVAIATNADLIEGLVLTNKVLTVAPSASWFDIPFTSRFQLLNKAVRSGVRHLISESTWTNRERYADEDAYFRSHWPELRFWHKMGIETFDNDLRAKLGKDYVIDSPEDVFRYTRNVTLLTGTIHHTKEVIDRDIDTALKLADLVEVNIIDDAFSPNPLASPEMIQYVHEAWGDTLRSAPHVVFTASPGTAWGADINPTARKLIAIKEQRS
jgi:hypothetical protein